ncbi:MAG: phosphatidate cytidylyltransferase, partial [Desulfobacterales bacterium]|nr:phosphatidate cytidylyltransferase [Desulfobacterales bacterium]
YYVGSYFGRHKLCPSISPGKTLEGAAAGLVANVVVGLVFRQLFLPAVSPANGLLFCLAVGAAGQVGDLFESEYKRRCRIKDSGSLLPGHGGILDRIDALLFAAPVAYFYKSYII